MKPSLAEIPFLTGAAPEVLAAADAESEWFSVPSGRPLIYAGEPPDGVFFLVSGSLAAFRPADSGGSQLLGYIRPGEPVGEMALIAKEPHSSGVFAMRDSEVLKLSADAFERLVHLNPKLMERMARLMLRRARANGRTSARADPKVYALIGTSPSIDLMLRAKTLQAALKRLGARAHIVSDADPGVMMGDGLSSAWFDALEQANDAVFLVSPVADTPWFRTCLRQADRIWIFARADARPSIPLLPPEDPSPARQFRLVDVVLLHHGSDRKAATTDEWRNACDASRLFHWRGLEDEDAARLARIIARRSIGLVLSGGGARAYAHIGVVRALREAGLPFDVVGGTSMGAIVAACVAMGWDDDEIEMHIRKAFVESNPLGDYVFPPVVALTRGKRVDDRLQEHFGETLIEDLKIPFFAVSTNLAAAALRVHRSGVLRKALRASISLPGILPPVVEGEHGLLVDGAVMRNFPVDTLKELHRGPIIGVDVALRDGINPEDFRDPPGFFRWYAQHGLAAPPIVSLLMRAATLAVDPWEGRSGADLLIAPEMGDIDMRDWRRYDEIVAAGYEAAAAALQRPHGLFQAPNVDIIGDLASGATMEAAE